MSESRRGTIAIIDNLDTQSKIFDAVRWAGLRHNNTVMSVECWSTADSFTRDESRLNIKAILARAQLNKGTFSGSQYLDYIHQRNQRADMSLPLGLVVDRHFAGVHEAIIRQRNQAIDVLRDDQLHSDAREFLKKHGFISV